nr:NUDIX hydrolase [Saprospiraceae bacterium]
YYSLIKLNEYYDKLPGEDFLIWRNIKDVDTLAFDHKEIFDVCLSRLQKQVKEQPVGFNLLPKKFTLNQLQELYEVILDVELDKRNFRRKLKSLNILQDHDELQTDVSHRPAKLYSFNKKLYEQRVADNFLF